MARSLQEVLEELENAEKEYADKCKKYGIEEKTKKKKVNEDLVQDNIEETQENNQND